MKKKENVKIRTLMREEERRGKGRRGEKMGPLTGLQEAVEMGRRNRWRGGGELRRGRHELQSQQSGVRCTVCVGVASERQSAGEIDKLDNVCTHVCVCIVYYSL